MRQLTEPVADPAVTDKTRARETTMVPTSDDSCSEEFAIGVDVLRALKVLSGNVFSGWRACIRELVANAADSITQLPLGQQGNVEIRVIPDRPSGLLIISDSGTGMTRREATAVLGTVFATSKEARKDTIGQFGIGFYSCFAMCSTVEVFTKSRQAGDPGTHLVYAGGEKLRIGPADSASHGTKVILHLLEQHQSCLDENVLLGLIREDCDFIPYPIYLGTGWTVLNRLDAPWYHDSPHGVLREALKNIYEIEDILALIPICRGAGNGTIRGLLYVGRSRQNPTLQVYSHRVLVTKSDEFLLDKSIRAFVSGVIDAEDLPLVLGRNAILEESPQATNLKVLLVECLGDGLAELAQERNPEFRRLMAEHGPVVKAACLEDEYLWTKLRDWLPYRSSLRPSVTVSEYLSTSPDTTVVYADDTSVGESLIPLYNQANIEVLFMTDAVDRALRDRWRWQGRRVQFKRLDVDPPSAPKSSAVSAALHVEAGMMESLRMLFRSCVEDTLDVEARQLGPEAPPALLAVSEQERQHLQLVEIVHRYEKEGRLTELPVDLQHWARMGVLDFVARLATRTLILNLSNDVVRVLIGRLGKNRPAMGGQAIEPLVAKFLYGQALLSSGLYLSSERLAELSQNQTELIGTILALLSGVD